MSTYSSQSLPPSNIQSHGGDPLVHRGECPPLPSARFTLHPTPMTLPAGGGPTGRRLHVILSGLARPGPGPRQAPQPRVENPTSFRSTSIISRCTMAYSHSGWWCWWWCFHGCRELVSHTHTHTHTQKKDFPSPLIFSIPGGHHQLCTSVSKPVCWSVCVCVRVCVCVWTIATDIEESGEGGGVCSNHISRKESRSEAESCSEVWK